MGTEWIDAKKWPDADKVAAMIAAIAKIKPHPTEGLAQALPEILAVLRVQTQGIAALHGAVHQITRYNEATHEQFAKQIDLVRTLVSAVKEQDKLVRKLTKRVDTLEKKLAKKTGSQTPVKKTGWFR